MCECSLCERWAIKDSMQYLNKNYLKDPRKNQSTSLTGIILLLSFSFFLIFLFLFVILFVITKHVPSLSLSLSSLLLLCRATREKWIKTKYQHKEFLDKSNLSQDELNRSLMDLLSVPNRDIFKILLLVAQVCERERERESEGEEEEGEERGEDKEERGER